MKIVLFAAPGIMGPYVFVSLLQRRKENIASLVVASGSHAVSPDEIIAIANQVKVPYFSPSNLKDPEFIQKIKAIEPDLIIIASYDRKIPKEILEIPKVMTVNLHPSLLPKYRGACPEFWAIRNGESETGVTLHRATESFDSGDILSQTKITLSQEETLGSLLYKVSDVSSKMLGAFLDGIHEGRLPEPRPQDETLATEAPLVTQNDLIIRWEKSADEISRLTRAANPLGGAWTFFRQNHLKIWFSKVYEGAVDGLGLSPGETALDEAGQKLLIQTGNGLLEVCSVQFAYYFILDGWNFAKQAHIQAGEKLGEQLESVSS